MNDDHSALIGNRPTSRTAPWTIDAICEAIAQILETVSPEECKNYVIEAGYNLT